MYDYQCNHHCQPMTQPHPPLLGVFAVGTRAGHPSLLLAGLVWQLQGQGLVHLQGWLAWRGRQLQSSALHGLDCEVLLAWITGDTRVKMKTQSLFCLSAFSLRAT